MEQELKTFENSYVIVHDLVERKRSRWTLKAINYLDFDDVKMIILSHINIKWGLYDQSKPLEQWVSTVVENQFKNMLRNLYMGSAKPCNRCAANGGGTCCTIYGEQCSDCPLYAEWEKKKKHTHNAKLPVSMEQHSHEVSQKSNVSFDLDLAIRNMHSKMLSSLKPNEYKVYKMLYIENNNEEEVAQLLGFKTSEKNRKIGYKRVRQYKNIIIQKAKKIILNGEIDFI